MAPGVAEGKELILERKQIEAMFLDFPVPWSLKASGDLLALASRSEAGVKHKR
jgi:hypothetical protein